MTELFVLFLKYLQALRYKSAWRHLQYKQFITLIVKILLSLNPKLGKHDSLSDLVSPYDYMTSL